MADRRGVRGEVGGAILEGLLVLAMILLMAIPAASLVGHAINYRFGGEPGGGNREEGGENGGGDFRSSGAGGYAAAGSSGGDCRGSNADSCRNGALGLEGD